MEEKNEKDEEKSIEKPILIEKDGLNIAYDKEELEKYYPHILSEISGKKKSIKMDSVELEIEPLAPKKKYSPPEELVNPGAIDFIRRCKTNKEALEILDYLFKKEEISLEEYNGLKNRVLKEGGLKELIEESGGFKEKGYYLDKYYYKD